MGFLQILIRFLYSVLVWEVVLEKEDKIKQVLGTEKKVEVVGWVVFGKITSLLNC